jgi:ERCC4-type nuclease
MGKGGGSSAPAQQNITQTNLPDYYKPYATRLMDRAEAQSLAPYEAYGGQRMADVSSDTGAAYDLTRQVAGQGIPGLDQAMGITQQNMYAGQQMANYQPYQFGPSQFQMTGANPYMGFQAGQADPYAGFQGTQFRGFGGFQAGQADPFAGFAATQVDPYTQFQVGRGQAYGGFQQAQFDPYTGFQAGSGEAFNYGPERQFTGEEVQQYMDPYLENVLDVQKQQAEKDYERARAGRSADAVQAGAFGGSRAAVQEGIAESEMLDRKARIEAEGRSAAFQQAATQFGADRSAQMQQREAQAQELARTQGISIDEARRVQESRAAEQARVQQSTADEMARVQQAQAAEMARVQGIDIEEAARIQQSQAAELARVQGISVDEFARVQQSKAAELARVQGIGIDEAARIQSAIADEQYRIQSANAEEFARIQQSQAAELARVQGISIEEAARVQAAQAQELARVQGITVDEAARVQAANAAERARVEGAQADENARAWANSMQALGFSGDQANQLAALGEMARAGDIQAAQLLETIGQQQEARQQQGFDLAYQDFLAQRNYPIDQLNQYSAIMRGIPVTPNTATTQYTPYNPMQQLLGAGLGTVGLYRGLTA